MNDEKIDLRTRMNPIEKHWKKILGIAVILLIISVGYILYNLYQDNKLEKEISYNQTLNSAFLNGSIYGQQILVASIHQEKEFPNFPIL